MPFPNRHTDAPRYADARGPVRYLDGSRLSRPLDMPRGQLVIVGALVAVAVVIGAYLLVTTIGGMHAATSHAQASVEENLTRDVSYDLPVMTQLVSLDDDGIRQSLQAAGYTVYEMPAASDDASLQLVKLPADVSVAEAAALYAQGVGSLDASDAALLLNGSWSLEVDREDAPSFTVRYADFSSGSAEGAVQAAIAAEGFDASAVAAEDQGVDEVGNTFCSGTVDVGGQTWSWRVSAIALSSVYDISGLPDTAVYVGIRLSA